ncbi:MAG: cell wall-binding repeat-containing protein [Oscillospiraceae bacterium]|jgi:putative cell wall-binding protein/spore coat protein CotH|nr:cell wall-binding repeat-containing protein [Oscillospiraceae bacterium]
MKTIKKLLSLLLAALLILSSVALYASAGTIPPNQSIPFAEIAATSTLPVINVDIENGAAKEKDEKDLKQNAELQLVNSNGKGKDFTAVKTLKKGSTTEYTYPLTIKGRGSSSWYLMGTGKKPYALKFDSKTDMLGMGKEKSWCLIPSWMDTTFMRNYLAYKLYKQLDPNGVDCELVELCINGVYEGIYLLTEKVELKDGNRLTFAETGEDVTGDGEIVSFLLEADMRGASEPNYFDTASGIRIVPKEPEDGDYSDTVMANSLDYIHSFMNQVDSTILSGGDYESLIDVDSLINLYIANELFKNTDFGFGYQPYYSSTFMYVREGGKLHFGSMWDVDLSLGRLDYNNEGEGFRDTLSPTGWLSKNTKWVKELFEDHAFEWRVKQRWQQVKPIADEILSTTLPEAKALLEPIQARDFQIWGPAGIRAPWGRNPFIFELETEYISLFLEQRIEWLDNAWSLLNRVSGSNRIETAVSIAQQGWPNGSDKVILASGSNFADALAGGSLSSALNAPILLTSNKLELEAKVEEAIGLLKTKEVVILGGESSVSKATADYLHDTKGLDIARYAGANRYETAVKIAQAVYDAAPYTSVFIADGRNFPDALASSPVSAILGQPILFTGSGDLNNYTSEFIKAAKISKAVLLGGGSSVNDSVAVSLVNASVDVKRISGGNRYETSLAVYNEYKDIFTGNTISFTTGSNFPDALAGSAYSASIYAPLILLSDNTDSDDVRTAASGKSNFIIYGGSSSLSDEAVLRHLKLDK